MHTYKETGPSSGYYYIGGLVITDQDGIPIRFNISDGFATPDGSGQVAKQYQLTDWLGTPRLGMDESGDITTTRDYYPYGKPLPGRFYTSSFEDRRYQFTGHEHDEENGHDYHGARFYNRDIAKYLSPDPLMGNNPHLSPYNYVSNNPIMRIDPDGMDDDIYVNKHGEVTRIVENDQPNRFFDEKGNELNLNDESNADNSLLNRIFHVGEKLYNNISTTEMLDYIIDAGVDNTTINLGSKMSKTAMDSHGSADFTFSYLLSEEYDLSLSGSEGGSVFRAGYADQAGYFRFEGSNTIYNLYDAGNFMWGSWMSFNNYPYWMVKFGSNLNEYIHLKFGDTDADQSAIKSGYYYGK